MRQGAIRLYVTGKEVTLDADSLVLQNWTREELTNPTIVKNSWSQSVKIPATGDNNAIFAGLWRADRYITDEAVFNPIKRADFQLVDARTSKVLQRGYAKVASVELNGDRPTSYSLDLYGGLGSFFYELSYNADGTKRTLADLRYLDFDQGQPRWWDPKTTKINLSAANVSKAWQWLGYFGDDRWEELDGVWTTLNFAPMYNGIPQGNFDANKAVYKAGTSVTGKVEGLYMSKNGYNPHSSAGGYILVEFENKHTEWEMQEFRAWQQRPIIRVWEIFRALTYQTNTGAYSVSISDGVKNNPYVKGGWMTLPLYDYEANGNTANNIAVSVLLEGTDSPAAYVIGLAKMLGFVFRYDDEFNSVEIMTRGEFYGEGKDIDLTDRVDVSQARTLTIYDAQSRYFDLSLECVGGKAEDYADRRGRNYGGLMIDTGQDFNKETSELITDTPFRGAAMVQGTSINYFVAGANADSMGSFQNHYLKFLMTEDVSWKIYKTTTKANDTALDCTNPLPMMRTMSYCRAYGSYGYDWAPRVQMCGDDDKPVQEGGVLLLFNGLKEFPAYITGGVSIDEAQFRLTDNPPSQAVGVLNNSRPCWDLTPANGTLLSTYPAFSRWGDVTNGGSSPELGEVTAVGRTWDFSDTPTEVFTRIKPTFAENAGVYATAWKDYLADRFDKNTRVLTCKVLLRGLQVTGELLRHRYYFDNTWWVLNKITNYSPAVEGTTECEFIKVNDWDNYTDGYGR